MGRKTSLKFISILVSKCGAISEWHNVGTHSGMRAWHLHYRMHCNQRCQHPTCSINRARSLLLSRMILLIRMCARHNDFLGHFCLLWLITVHPGEGYPVYCTYLDLVDRLYCFHSSQNVHPNELYAVYHTHVDLADHFYCVA